MPFAKGQSGNPAGRKKGTPNKATAEVREVFKRILDDLAPEAEQWIRQTAEEDPKGAADLLLKLAEFHVPKLARTEVTGKDGEALTVKVVTYGSEGDE